MIASIIGVYLTFRGLHAGICNQCGQSGLISLYMGIACGMLLLIFVLLCGFLIALPYRVELYGINIVYRLPPFGNFEMRWDEVNWIEATSDRGWVVYHGHNKRLATIGPSWARFWGRKEQIENLWANEVQARGIPVKTNDLAFLKFTCKNTRVM